MRCTCQVCGAYMVQEEKGLESRCVCPDCLFHCAACMGTAQQPVSRDALARLLEERQFWDDEHEET